MSMCRQVGWTALPEKCVQYSGKRVKRYLNMHDVRVCYRWLIHQLNSRLIFRRARTMITQNNEIHAYTRNNKYYAKQWATT